MSVKIRLKRMGTKKRPFYRIVATDSRNRRDGRFIEELGFYDPLAVAPVPAVKVDEELFFKWLKCGAIPSENVEGIVRRLGIMKKWQLVRAGVPAEQIDEKLAAQLASETKGATPDERRRKFVQKRTARKAAAAPAEGA